MGDETTVKPGQQFRRQNDGVIVSVVEALDTEAPGGGRMWTCEIVLGEGNGDALKVPERGLLDREYWSRLD